MGKKKSTKFPKQIYVHESGDREPILLVDTDVEDIENGSEVAIYELRSVKIKREQHALEDK